MRRLLIFVMSAIAFAPAEITASAADAKDTCVECHGQLDGELKAPVDTIGHDVHFERGLSCADCHGGDPSASDFDAAKSPEKHFIGRPKHLEIPEFCGRCHADPEYMRRFDPNMPTDQLSKYNNSRHGKLKAKGDEKTAVCISCHDVHGVRKKTDPLSSMFATNAPYRCASCHSDKEYMKDYAIPTNQMDEYKESVHGQALLVRGDRGAAGCNDCHGSHDATLPRVIAVGNVCAQCHSLTRDLFAKSPHKAAHDALDLPECEVCHGNHKILRPSDEMLGTTAPALCPTCHQSGSRGYLAASGMRSAIELLKSRIGASEEMVSRAEQLGMEMSDAVFSIDEAKNRLTKARSHIHSFSSKTVEEITNEGINLAEKAFEEGKESIGEFNFRRKGYAVAVAIILLLAVLVYLKVRQIEKISA